MDFIKVSKPMANELVSLLQLTLCELSVEQIKYVYICKNQALVISFDAYWEPFVGYTKGYNWPDVPDARTYLKRIPRLLELIRSIYMRERNKEIGGRVFIDEGSSYYVDALSNKTPLCELSWPNGINVPREVCQYLRKLKQQY